MKRTKLSSKIAIVFVSFTFFLLAITLLYFYYASLSSLKEQSSLRITFLLKNFNFLLQKETKDLFTELQSLEVFIDNEFTITENLDQEKGLAERILKKYLLDNPLKYITIKIYKKDWSDHLEGNTSRLFNGDIAVNISRIKNAGADPLSDIITYPHVMNPYIDFSAEQLLLNVATDKNAILLAASPEKLFFFEKVIEKLKPGKNVSINVISAKNIIIYSTDKRLINQNYQKFLSGSGSLPIIDMNMHNNILSGIGKNSEYNLYIRIAEDLSEELERLYSTAVRIFIFSIVILLCVLFIILVYANRLSISLSEITNVTRLVASGNFRTKIKVTRNDELGMLIDSFNDMTGKLDQSYKTLNELNSQLENKIRELTEARNELTQKQRLALVGETISKISHEIQNKISGISIWIQNLELHLKNDSTADVYINEIKTAMSSFLDKLINFKKFYRQPQLNIGQVSLPAFIDAVLDKYIPEIQLKQISIIKEYDCSCTLEADREQLEEVLENILINALYYSPEKGNIKIKLEKSGSRVVMFCYDEGPGINEESIDKILQPFYTTKPTGSGLGLTIANNIITQHKGILKFYNIPDAGACFEIILPIKQEKE